MLYFEEFYIFQSIFWGSVLFIRCFSKHRSSLISYHASLLLNESRLRKVFFRVLLFGKYFLGFLLVAMYFLGRSEMPNSADPCLYVCQVHPLGPKVENLDLRGTRQNIYHSKRHSSNLIRNIIFIESEAFCQTYWNFNGI